MTRSLATFAIFFIYASMAWSHGSAPPSATSVEPRQVRAGQPYPDFELPTINGRKPTRLSDYRGKKVLLIQFASW